MIKFASSREELEKIFQLRYEVLRKPWGQPFESSKDDLDEISFNAFMEKNGMCVACGRLDIIDEQTAQIRYMAVHPQFRGKKFGQNILRYLEQTAKENGLKKIFLHARENAVSFYEQNGYRVIRPSHVLFQSIQHYLMEKCI
ncbi:MAG: hypothetical protein Fur0023_06470 [Bacteroidia bacterium]